ncbi:hypothetical protein MJV52_002281 [Listeria monocytogenes]|uniref:Uncharacterized protein n=2 Tax=Listeria TaxID=1637 RepID=A0A3T1YJX1_LISMN|nr:MULTISPECIES: hypothetical protein [Listeria]YP_001468783.1 gp79 [Listeria phage B054]MDA56086.1 hypothetical protein [Listeria monocytogenes serotype 4b]AAY53184.1 gp79 [Listeria phage B054]ASD76057.1 hypothetical protein ARX15_08875 [Listeria monocytogenes]ASW39478.1 hypothetical protein B1S31_08885 [Listeria monocytogenes]ASW78225.1 hypothetical protein ARX13_08875 [Listeria monocytogenes]
MTKQNRRSIDENANDELLDLEISKALEEVKTDEEYKKIIRATLGKWLNNLQEGNIRLESVNDLKTLIEADRLLRRD